MVMVAPVAVVAVMVMVVVVVRKELRLLDHRRVGLGRGEGGGVLGLQHRPRVRDRPQQVGVGGRWRLPDARRRRAIRGNGARERTHRTQQQDHVLVHVPRTSMPTRSSSRPVHRDAGVRRDDGRRRIKPSLHERRGLANRERARPRRRQHAERPGCSPSPPAAITSIEPDPHVSRPNQLRAVFLSCRTPHLLTMASSRSRRVATAQIPACLFTDPDRRSDGILQTISDAPILGASIDRPRRMVVNSPSGLQPRSGPAPHRSRGRRADAPAALPAVRSRRRPSATCRARRGCRSAGSARCRPPA